MYNRLLLFIFALILAGSIPRFALADPGSRPSLGATGSIDTLASAKMLASQGEIRLAHTLVTRVPAATDLEIRLLTEMGQFAEADSLLGLHAPLVDDRDVFFYALRRARLNVLLGRFDAALDHLDAVASLSDPMFNAYRDDLCFLAYAGLGRLEEAIPFGERLVETGVPAAMSPELEMALIDAYEAAGQPGRALALAEKVWRKGRGREEKTGAMVAMYDLYVQTGAFSKARSMAVDLARSYRPGPAIDRVVDDVLFRVRHADLTNDELLAYGSYLVAAGRLKEAGRLIGLLGGRRLGTAHWEERRMLLAQIHFASGRYRSALDLARQRFAGASLKRRSTLLAARSYRKLGEARRAARLYEYFADTFPNDIKAAEALHVAANLYDDLGERGAADRVRDHLRKSYPSTYYGRLATVWTARSLAERGRSQRSLAILESAVTRSRRTDEAALYYLAQTLSVMGDRDRNQMLLDELKKLDKYSFYLNAGIPKVFDRPVTTSTGEVALDGDRGLVAFLAAIEDKKQAARGRIEKFLANSPSGASDPSGDAAACLARGKWFLDAGFTDWAERELETARRRCLNSPSELLELAEIYDRHGMPWRTIRLYQRVEDSFHWKKRREFQDDFRYLLYPTPYPVQVLENSARYDLPPHLIYAMIREESRFDEQAVSRVGALGLMQLMPETARYVARELELPEWGEERLFEPETNLAFGVWYASSLMGGGNDYLRMLAAYNAGPGNARRWFDRRRGSKSTIEIVDDIDYKETRGYVQRIVESANVYHSLYFDPDADRASTGR